VEVGGTRNVEHYRLSYPQSERMTTPDRRIVSQNFIITQPNPDRPVPSRSLHFTPFSGTIRLCIHRIRQGGRPWDFHSGSRSY